MPPIPPFLLLDEPIIPFELETNHPTLWFVVSDALWSQSIRILILKAKCLEFKVLLFSSKGLDLNESCITGMKYRIVSFLFCFLPHPRPQQIFIEDLVYSFHRMRHAEMNQAGPCLSAQWVVHGSAAWASSGN